MRRRVLDIFVSVFVTVLLLVGVEFGAGFVLAGTPSPTDPLRFAGNDDAVSKTLSFLDINLAPLDKDVDLLWRNRPSIEKRQQVNPQRYGRHDEWTIRTSSRGFRGPELSLETKSKGVLRILCVGDSVTFGFNVDQEDTYPERLQALLRKRFPGRQIEVINAASPGWSWVQGAHFLEREGIALRPDVVIMAHGANDRFFPSTTTDEERIGRLRGVGVRWTESARLLLERTNTYRLVQQRFGPSAGPDSALSPGCRRQMSETGRCRRVGLDEIETSISLAHKMALEAGASLLVLNVDFMETDAVAAVRKTVAREKIPFLDLVAGHRQLQREDEGERAHRLNLAPAKKPARRFDASMPPTRVLFRVLVVGGADSIAVRGRTFTEGKEFGAELSDDGTGGDEIPRDGVWSGWLAVPSDLLLYRYFRDDAAEFDALPPLPSAQGCRQRDAVGLTVFPVEVFSDLFLMVEHMHPNAAGQQFIAESVLGVLPSLDAFARWASDGAGACVFQ